MQPGDWRLPRLSRTDITALVVLLCVIAFGLRVWNVNWDDSQHQHPDERFWSIVAGDVSAPSSVGEYFDSANSPANPYNNNHSTWVYGTMPLFAGKAAAAWMLDGPGGSVAVDVFDSLGVSLRNDDGNTIFNAAYESNLIGRIVSALVDTATVAAVFVLASMLARNRRIGLLAALLQTFTVLHIQYAHFFGSEPWVALFATLVVIGSVRIARGEGSWRTVLATGLLLGLAVAAKLNGAAVAMAPLAATLIPAAPAIGRFLRPQGIRYRRANAFRTIVYHGSNFLAIALAAAFAFRIAQPYVFTSGFSLRLDDRFLTDFDYISGVNSGANVPWVIQWIDRTPLLFPLRQLFVWGMGPTLGTIAAMGLALAVWRVVKRRQWVWLVPLSVIGAYLLLVSRQFNPVIRYLLPAYPTAIALGAIALAALWRAAAPRASWVPSFVIAQWRRLTAATVVLLVGGSVFYGLAFVNGVYNERHTRLAASDWIVENIPPGSSISHQVWDDALPLGVPGAFDQGYQIIDLEPFLTDSARVTSSVNDQVSVSKTVELINRLDRTTYIVEASNKLYGAIPQIPARYPSTTRYYDALFSGELGFEPIAEFTNPPSLLGITFDSRDAEETFTVYDHPAVTIWEKTDRWSVGNAALLLNPDRGETGIEVEPRFSNANALQLRPDDYAIQQAGGTWTDAFDDDGLSTNAPWFWWLLWLQITSFAAIPITTAVFARLPGHGYGLSKMVGFLGVAMPLWLAVSYGPVRFGSTSAWVGALLFAAVGVVVGWRRRAFLAEAFRRHRRLWLATEAVFLLAFFVVLALRYANPDVWHQFRGGEKPMELAYFTSVARSATLPPYDPWFGGGFLNYYYVGWFLLAVPTRALHLPPDIAFNLGVATYAALAASVVFTTATSLVGLGARSQAATTDEARTLSPKIAPGVFGVLMFGVLGNLDSARQTIRHLRTASTWTADVPVVRPIVEIFGGLWIWLRGDIERFDWWDPSRVNKGTPDKVIFDITEFPAWTVLFADLHPHFMDMAVFGLLIAAALAFLASNDAGDRRRTVLLAGSLGAGGALVRMVHTWDFPTAMLLGVAVIGVAWYQDRGVAARWRLGLIHLLAFVVTYLVVVTPYQNSSQVFENSLDWEPGFTSNLDDFLVHWGLFLFIAVVYVLMRLRDLGSYGGDKIAMVARIAVAAVAFVYVHDRVGSVAAWAVLAILVTVSLLVAEISKPQGSVAHIAVAGFWALGFGIIFGVEIVRVGQDIDRLNTIFKFWLQVWHLFALAAAFAVWWVGRGLRAWAAERREADRSVSSIRSLRVGWVAVLVVLVIGAAVFPLRAPAVRNADRFDVAAGDGLRGWSWLDSPPEITTITTYDQITLNLADDAEMLDWLRQNVQGSPTVVEAVGPSYQWFGRVTSATGLPAVVGWDWHQRQQRGLFGGEVEKRRADVDRFYRDADPVEAQRFLRRYDVGYVIVGSTERAVMGPGVQEMIDSLPTLTLVFDDDVAKVYSVNRSELLTQGSSSIEVAQSG